MPELFFPIRRLLPVPVLLVALALAACGGGDFGRTRADFRSDDMHAWIGRQAVAGI